MKPFYGIDNTNNAENEKENGDEFLVQKPDEKLYAEYDKAVNGVFANISKSLKLPFILKVIQYLALSVGGFLICTLFEYFISEEISEINTIALKIIFVIILCAVIFIVLNFIVKNLIKNEDESEEQHLQSRKANAIHQRLLNDLGVPMDASNIDILSFNYKIEKDTIKIDKCSMSVPMFYNMEFSAFRDDENLYLVTDSGKYAFKLSSIKTVHKIEHKNALFVWNKNVPCNEGEYKQYKMKEDEMGNIRCKSYYVLELENNGEAWGIYLPEYELETVKKIAMITS